MIETKHKNQYKKRVHRLADIVSKPKVLGVKITRWTKPFNNYNFRHSYGDLHFISENKYNYENYISSQKGQMSSSIGDSLEIFRNKNSGLFTLELTKSNHIYY